MYQTVLNFTSKRVENAQFHIYCPTMLHLKFPEQIFCKSKILQVFF